MIKNALGNFKIDAKLCQARSKRATQVVQTHVEQRGIAANPLDQFMHSHWPLPVESKYHRPNTRQRLQCFHQRIGQWYLKWTRALVPLGRQSPLASIEVKLRLRHKAHLIAPSTRQQYYPEVSSRQFR